jgi:nicotinamidase-related amidase
MTSRPNPPLPPIAHACLLLVDPQRLFTDPTSPAFVPGWPAARANAGRLTAAFLARGWPVLRTRHVHPADDDGGTLRWFFHRLQRADDPWSEVDAHAVPGAAATPLVDKARLSALSVPAIAEAAGRGGVLVLAGVQTHRCVLATAVDAARLGLCPVVIGDACAARPTERHAQALAVLADGHAFVASTDALLASLGGESR